MAVVDTQLPASAVGAGPPRGVGVGLGVGVGVGDGLTAAVFVGCSVGVVAVLTAPHPSTRQDGRNINRVASPPRL